MSEQVIPSTLLEYDPFEFLVVQTADLAPVAAGQYTLEFEFAGRLDDSIVGFYRCDAAVLFIV